MKPNTKIAIAGLLSAASAVLAAFAAEFNGEPAEATTNTPEAPKTRKPRAAKTEEPAAAEAAAAEPEPATEKPAETSPEGKTYKDMQDLIRPLVTQSAEMGAEVKKIIAKYSETGLKGMDPKDYPAFEKDIAVLGC